MRLMLATDGAPAPELLLPTRDQATDGSGWQRSVAALRDSSLATRPRQHPRTSSWEESTSNGTLAGTYDPTSKICFIASMTASHMGSEHGVVDLLLANAVQKSVRERKQTAYFISPMPGYHEHADTMTPEAYAAATRVQDGKTVALDPQIRFYEEFGTKPLRLVENGFAAD